MYGEFQKSTRAFCRSTIPLSGSNSRADTELGMARWTALPVSNSSWMVCSVSFLTADAANRVELYVNSMREVTVQQDSADGSLVVQAATDGKRQVRVTREGLGAGGRSV